jgi:hypothetical protein
MFLHEKARLKSIQHVTCVLLWFIDALVPLTQLMSQIEALHIHKQKPPFTVSYSIESKWLLLSDSDKTQVALTLISYRRKSLSANLKLEEIEWFIARARKIDQIMLLACEFTIY